MPAGRSAGVGARREALLAGAHAAEVSEKATVAALGRLAGVGYHLLADRRWPGSRTANVDLVVVGPGGVFIVDTKWWADVSVAQGRIFRGQDDVTEELYALADLGQTVEADLADVGLSPNEIHPVVVLHGRSGISETVASVRVLGEGDALRFIAGHGQRHTPAAVDLLLARCLDLFPAMGNADAAAHAVAVDPVRPADRAWEEPLLSDREIDAALFDSLLASPVEDWMAFLHPAQAKLVRRSFNGPSRIRGSAGTGKTVVGLHRAAYLARMNPHGKVLVTTFVNTLPGVMAQSLARLAPEAVDRVIFTSVHRFARRVLDARGVTVRVDPGKALTAFNLAWVRTGRHSVLGGIDLPVTYWQEEVVVVLRGRGITDFDAYADLARTGRKHRLSLEQRRGVWELHLAYDAQLRALGITDFAGSILLAEAALQSVPYGSAPGEESIAAVIVDEAQDLTCAQIRLLHALTGDAPDGLTLIGDGQQSIYPGGYTLAEAGVSLAGRGVVMDVNYRNTAQIVEFASRLVDGDEFADIEGATSRADRTDRVTRTGPEPVLWRGPQPDAAAALVARVREVLTGVGTDAADIGVLSPTHAGVQGALRALAAAGIPTINLADYEGVPVDAVKVGTIKRAKGLEFKQVLVCAVPAALVAADAQPPAADADRERWDRDRRELFVAMTRARDGLWVSTTGT
ncbi:Part of AAA domain-containing protein [Sanguibacter gelidistatuariae]|uniref:DNA 3'-5' helicase n=1 Tax=Sanguibacter gelidistatuariae TaxID=1814289 RepID=A0A1G6K8Z6_9MICO|nr:UvrD-helicase domain-containing protein [Sanguibacter gelidistatuariae]SDC26776.1 Part of AAA domain-containing protein [Sanguibacter gelidistatuariae]